MIPVDPSVTEGRCYVCGSPVVVPATEGGDFVGNPLPAAEMAGDLVLIRMCDECLADFARWREKQATADEPARRSDA